MPPREYGPNAALHLARDDDYGALRAAAEAGLDVRAGNSIGQTALHVAALHGHTRTVTALLDLGCPPDAQNDMQQTPLHFAASAQRNAYAVCEVLVAHGARMDIEDSRGNLAYENAVDDDVRELLGGPDRRLFAAAAAGDVAALRELLPGSADAFGYVPNPAPFNSDGLSTVHLAAAGGHLGALNYLLERGAFPSQQDLTAAGDTAAHHAARRGHVAVLTLLARRGAALDTPNFQASQYARGDWVSGGRALGQLHQTPLHVAAEVGDAGTAAHLLRLGCDANAVDFDGRTPLHYAIEAQDKELAETLLAHGADPNRSCADFASPAHLAALQGAAPLLRLLLASGAAADAADAQGWTPLMLAARNGRTAAVEVLIQAGVDAAAQNARGSSALHLAAANGRAALCAALLAAPVGGGAAAALRNGEGKTAAEVARGEEVAQLLAAAAAPQRRAGGEATLVGGGGPL